jgi:hypothetical protein
MVKSGKVPRYRQCSTAGELLAECWRLDPQFPGPSTTAGELLADWRRREPHTTPTVRDAYYTLCAMPHADGRTDGT